MTPPRPYRPEVRLLLVAAGALFALGLAAMVGFLLLSQRERPRDPRATEQLQPGRAAFTTPTPAPLEADGGTYGRPSPLAGSAGAPVDDDDPSLAAAAGLNLGDGSLEVLAAPPDHGSLPGRWGLPRAPVTIVVFSDFQCPFCGRLANTFEDLHRRFPTEVELYFRDRPLDFHPQARGAHISARCADQQGRFWLMHDMLFQHQRDLDVETFEVLARELELDLPRFRGCRESAAAANAVDQDLAAAVAAGVSGTPTSFVNGQRVVGAQPLAAFVEAVEAAMEPAR